MTHTVLQRKLLPTLDFLLHEWLDVPRLLERERFAEHTRESCDEVLRAASQIAADYFEPANRTSDEQPPVMRDGGVKLPKESHAAWGAYNGFGFLGASHDEAYGGMQLPKTVDMATRVIFAASGPHLGPTLLTDANASLILEHGSEEQKRVFALPQLTGRWAGTMCLSESHAGSSLSDISTKAVPDGPDFGSDPLGPRYRITGNKMWISAAEHDLTENIVHLVLAKVPDADGVVDPSTRGISLFIMPKFLPASDGSLGERNDISLISLNHKLGQTGVPNTALALGDGTYQPRGARGAVGHLVGEVGDGLRQMFHMMNAARTEIGLSAAAIGLAGYAVSLDYARHRRQGRHAGPRGKDASQPQVPIIEHADVKRMLLAQKAYAEGGVALALQAARLLDEQQTGSPEQAKDALLLLEILTPVVKSWPSEWCLEGNSLAIQVLGGAGYTKDYPVELYWRDQRINMIHEGTHGIHGLDLLGRKVRMAGGAGLDLLGSRVETTADTARARGLDDLANQLLQAWRLVVQTTKQAWSTGDPADALANATPYLQGFGHVVLAWVHLDLAAAALVSSHPESAGRLAAARYFFSYELPRAKAWLDLAASRESLCRDLPLDAF
ncbi:acyl-CoA dehydrogenase [Streptomyces spongiae]|uniref:Acyl-CoA dehydrogenase n=1 Tax=Streptomyces spongiae TaxID=565072 RepID=A0A5N8XAH0_9ACTN|nr:acyl-CoA dehydrogenase [Streptomyces spongiae]MPY56387.1 acyl-CoA dehydrogenase [Streptomyces spongiae]